METNEMQKGKFGENGYLPPQISMTCDLRDQMSVATHSLKWPISNFSFQNTRHIFFLLITHPSVCYFILEESAEMKVGLTAEKQPEKTENYKNKSRLKLQETEELRTDAKSQKPKTKTVQLAYCCVHIKFKEINEYLSKVRLQIEHVKALE